MQAGIEYTVMPCTKDAHVTLPFTLTLYTSSPATLDEIPPEPELGLRGAWSERASPPTAGGCPNNPDTWTNNPQFALTVSQPTVLTGVLGLELEAARSAALREEQAPPPPATATVPAASFSL